MKTGSVSVVFNGELFDYIEQKAELESRGHRFVTHCDTEILPHLWEESQEDMFVRLRGQFAVALWDERKQKLTLGTRPLRHLPALLDAPGRLAPFRIRDQRVARLGHGARPARLARN